MIKMEMWYGREEIDHELDDDGFEGPVIRNIERVVVTYSQTLRLFFLNREDLEQAVELTGWRELDDDILEVPYENDMVRTKDGWFGDYSITSEEQ